MVYRTNYYSQQLQKAENLVSALDYSLLCYLHYNGLNLEKPDMSKLFRAAELDANNSEIRGLVFECLEKRINSRKDSAYCKKDKRFADSFSLFRQVYFRDCNNVMNGLIEVFNKHLPLHGIMPKPVKGQIPSFEIEFDDNLITLKDNEYFGLEYYKYYPAYQSKINKYIRTCLFTRIIVEPSIWWKAEVNVQESSWHERFCDKEYTRCHGHKSITNFKYEAKEAYFAYFLEPAYLDCRSINRFMEWFTNFRNIPQRLNALIGNKLVNT